jgi:hypothetical protein
LGKKIGKPSSIQIDNATMIKIGDSMSSKSMAAILFGIFKNS